MGNVNSLIILTRAVFPFIFFSSVTFTSVLWFWYVALLLLWLNLFLFYCFHCYYKWDCFLVFQIVHYWYREIQLVFVFWCWFSWNLIHFLALTISLWGFKIFLYMRSCYLERQFYFLPNWVPLIFFFSFMIALARISSTVSNESGENGQPCLVLDLRLKVFSFSSSMVLVVDLSYMAFVMLKYVSFIWNLLSL